MSDGSLKGRHPPVFPSGILVGIHNAFADVESFKKRLMEGSRQVATGGINSQGVDDDHYSED